jgi:hypothetical protein
MTAHRTFLHSTCLAAIALLCAAVRADDWKTASTGFVQKFCVDCHSGDSPDADLRLDTLGTSLADRTAFDVWVKLHDKVAAREMPPADAPQPTDAERAAFTKAIAAPLVEVDLARQREFGRTTLRRLNRVEFDYTLRDLLALPHADYHELLPADPSAHGYDVVGEALPMSYVQQAAYLQAAETALRDALVLRPKPERREYKFAFLEEGRLAFAKGVKRPDDGLALMSNFVLGPTFYMGNFGARDTGPYHITLRAGTVTYKDGELLPGVKPQVIMLYAEVGTSSRHLVTFEAPVDKIADLKVTTWLNAGERIRLIVPTLHKSAAPYRANQRDLKYVGPSVAFHTFAADGPVWESWPPASHERVLGDVPLVVPPRVRPPPPVPPPLLVTESANPAADARRLVERLVKRAFRRPVAQAELDRYVKLAEDRIAAGAPLYDAVQTGYKGAFCSPDFLYFLEQPGRLDDYALASRLSYFLWRSLPDEELAASAAAGKLRDPTELRRQADRLLDDLRSARFVADFTDQWLDLREIGFTQPDEDLYPEYDDLHLIDSLLRETRAYFAELLHSDLPVRNVVESDFACLNGVLADLYQIDGVTGIDVRRVKLPPNHVRGGIITQAGVLKVTANGTTTSPVPRGAWLLERIVGKPVPPPPKAVPAIEPDIKGATTVREQLAKHREVKACAGCHAKLDPPGFALESFDVLGGYRERYRSLGTGEAVTTTFRGHKKKYKLGLPVDASGEVADGRKFGDVREYQQLLLQDEAQLARNLVQQLTTFATGAPVQFADRRDVEEIVVRLKSKEYGLRSLVHEVIAIRMFQNK